MPNKIRPRCPECRVAMAPVFTKGPRGALVKVSQIFVCLPHNELAQVKAGKPMPKAEEAGKKGKAATKGA